MTDEKSHEPAYRRGADLHGYTSAVDRPLSASIRALSLIREWRFCSFDRRFADDDPRKHASRGLVFPQRAREHHQDADETRASNLAWLHFLIRPVPRGPRRSAYLNHLAAWSGTEGPTPANNRQEAPILRQPDNSILLDTTHKGATALPNRRSTAVERPKLPTEQGRHLR